MIFFFSDSDMFGFAIRASLNIDIWNWKLEFMAETMDLISFVNFGKSPEISDYRPVCHAFGLDRDQ
jgi:hypothetical protein